MQNRISMFVMFERYYIIITTKSVILHLNSSNGRSHVNYTGKTLRLSLQRIHIFLNNIYTLKLEIFL